VDKHANWSSRWGRLTVDKHAINLSRWATLKVDKHANSFTHWCKLIVDKHAIGLLAGDYLYLRQTSHWQTSDNTSKSTSYEEQHTMLFIDTEISISVSGTTRVAAWLERWLRCDTSWHASLPWERPPSTTTQSEASTSPFSISDEHVRCRNSAECWLLIKATFNATVTDRNGNPYHSRCELTCSKEWLDLLIYQRLLLFSRR
jgi:hypothetical protein